VTFAVLATKVILKVLSPAFSKTQFVSASYSTMGSQRSRISRSNDREINILCDAMRDPLKLSIQAVHIEHEFVCFFPYMN